MKRTGHLLLAGSALSGAVALVAGCRGPAQAQAQMAPPPPAVSVAAVEERKITEWDEFIGRLEAVDSVEIRPRVSGYIERVVFTAGKEVRKGDVLFQIDRAPLPGRAGARRGRPRSGAQRRRAGHAQPGPIQDAGRRRCDLEGRSRQPHRRRRARRRRRAGRAGRRRDRASQPRVDQGPLADPRPGRARRGHRRQPGPARRPHAPDHRGVAGSDLRHLRRRRAQLPQVRVARRRRPSRSPRADPARHRQRRPTHSRTKATSTSSTTSWIRAAARCARAPSSPTRTICSRRGCSRG